MSSMSMSHGMGGMSMGDGVPSLFYVQKMYWAVVGTAIALATIVNVYNNALYRQRMFAAGRHKIGPAKPWAFLPSTMATIFALTRELTYANCSFLLSKRLRWTSPTLGRVFMVSAELVLVLVLCFYKLDPHDQWQWEDIGYRTGFVATAQLPLVVLLAGKRNIIGWLTGTSYERLNWLHRWVSRILFLTVTIHMGFWFVGWARYDYIKVKLATDPITQRGFAAWCILLWIVLSSLAPARRWNYEFFVIQHIVTFIGFFAVVYLHLPAEVKFWVWIPIGLFLFDRSVRAIFTLFINVSILNLKIETSKTLAPSATFEPLSGRTTRITIENPPFHWEAGQHVFLSCHALAPLQAHPFTIASIPADKRLEFLVKTKSGSTKRFFRHAERSQELPLASGDPRRRHQRSVLLEGPYGRIRPLRQFDSVFFIAGSSGATFTVPLMRDIVLHWKEPRLGQAIMNYRPDFAFNGAVTRFIRFIWVIKSRSQFAWFASQLETVLADVQQLREKFCTFEVKTSIYITCDDVLGGADPSTSKSEILEGESLYGGRQTPLDPMHRKTDLAASTQSPKDDLVKQGKGIVSVESVSSAPSDSHDAKDKATSCRPDGTCCCKQTIEDEGQALESGCQCHCGDGVDKIEMIKDQTTSIKSSQQEGKSSSAATSADEKTELLDRPEIPMISGRPLPRKLIRETLEQALGESAVVVCGPQGLVDDVRQSVVYLSDERAVHKGSGAQGIYLHAESFDY
ncbi:MAG: hypothetical protein Q9166_002780 [cf. Caloplaca sp. 2 TL-2023]